MATDEYQALIGALVSERKLRGITQHALAHELGKPQSYVSKIERGERRLDVIELVRICQILQLDPHDVLSEVVRRSPANKKTKRRQ